MGQGVTFCKTPIKKGTLQLRIQDISAKDDKGKRVKIDLPFMMAEREKALSELLASCDREGKARYKESVITVKSVGYRKELQQGEYERTIAIPFSQYRILNAPSTLELTIEESLSYRASH